MTKNRTPTPVYLDPGMHPGLEVKGLRCRFSNHSIFRIYKSTLQYIYIFRLYISTLTGFKDIEVKWARLTCLIV